MPVKLVLTRVEEPDSPDEYIFDRTPIVIGRAGGSHLTVPDYKRIVSKEHAKVDEADGSYTVTDLGSKNYTFLNGKRLESGQAYPLQDGDLIALGEFQVEFQKVAPAAPDYDKTVFDLSFGNPFDEAAEQLAEALDTIRTRFDEEEPRRRVDALREALDAVLPEARRHEAEQLIAELLAPNGAAPGAASETPGAPSQASSSPEPPRERQAAVPERGPKPEEPSSSGPAASAAPVSAEPTPKPSSQPSTTSPSISASESRLERFAHAVLDATARLVSTPWRFRHEFIGQTIMQSADSAFLYEGDARDLQRMLLSDELDEGTFAERLQLLREALDDLAVHQIALLDGYKAAVNEGAQRLLDSMDPQAVAKDTDLDSPLFKLMPAKAKAEVLEQLEERARDLRAEDWSVTERRVYRPAFVKAYLARMTSIRRE